MPFQIQIIGDTTDQVFLSAPNGQIHQYETGAQAAAIVSENRNLDSQNGISRRFRIVKVDSDNDSIDDSWKLRERHHFHSGYYAPVPWSKEPWFVTSAFYDSHFCHLSRDKDGLLAYTESHEKGMEDRQTRIRAGKYLRTYFSNTLTCEEIKHWAGKVSAANGEGETVFFAKTPDEIEEVYTNGPDSCMSHSESHFESDCHPVRVYGAGDLAIAYITRKDNITARCLSWPERKIYSTIYGDGGFWSDQLANMLQNMGFEKGVISSKWNGARLLRIEQNGGFIAPYLDVPNSLSDNGDYLVLSGNGYIESQNTNGLTEQGGTCAICMENYNSEESGGYIESTEQYVCDYCYSENSFYCEDCNTTCHTDDAQWIENNLVCDSCADSYPTCDECSEKHSESRSVYAEIAGETFCENCYSDVCSTCIECNESDRTSDMKETVESDFVCTDCHKEYSVCVECDKSDKIEDSYINDTGDSYCSNCRQTEMSLNEESN
jgi:hypothetical protein